jgi:hypothetical protein
VTISPVFKLYTKTKCNKPENLYEANNFLEKYNLLKLTPIELASLNGLIRASLIRKLQAQMISGEIFQPSQIR